MASRKPFLSKSKLIAAWQCAKRLHLEKHHPEYGQVSARTESLWETGHRVGEVARQLYGTESSVEIEFDFKSMLAETKRLIEGGADFPIFEATFKHENVLVRVDVLIPDRNGWRAIEVKASTSVKEYHILDCAIQSWVMRSCGINVTSIALAHINNQFVYPGNDDYEGLLIENDVTDEARTLEPAVIELLVKARDAVAGQIPDIPVGAHCTSPYDCQFIGHCWPTESEYPIGGLGGNKAKLGNWVAAGHRDIRDVDAADISAANQLRIHHVTCQGKPEILPGAKAAFDALAYPRYFLDFETISPAVPFWAGTRPYQAIPVQWSVHREDERGELTHRDFLDLSGIAPMRALAERLIEALGNAGPVLMYTNYEEQVLKTLIDLLPEFEAPLTAIIGRLYDLHPVVKEHYYHPQMLGSWSIKAVMPTIRPNMDYARLDGIKEGTAASDGFLEAIDPATDLVRKAELEEQLLRYCKFDTEAMLEIVRFFTAEST